MSLDEEFVPDSDALLDSSNDDETQDVDDLVQEDN